MKYIRKPITVEAFQYDGDLKGTDGKYYVPDWAVKAFGKGDIYYDFAGDEPSELFVNFEHPVRGRWVLEIGDYIIKENSEIYVLSNRSFNERYELPKEPHETNIKTYLSITGIVLKAEPAVRIGELNYTELEPIPRTMERREQGYRVYFKSGVTTWIDKAEFERIHTKVKFPNK